MKHVFIFLSMLMLCVMGGAQTNYTQRKLTIDDGLASNAVRQIVQDSRRFIWIGTESGLCRYDGNTVCTYAVGGGESSLPVTALLAGKDGRLLVGTSKGVYDFDFATETFALLPVELTAAVSSLTTDKSGNLWISTKGQGVVCYSDVDGQDPKFYTLNGLDGMVDMIFSDADNQLWVISRAAQATVWKLNKSKDVFEAVNLQSPVAAALSCMMQTSDGTLWLGTWENGLMCLRDGATLEQMPILAPGHHQHIRALYELNNHEILLGCDDGLWRFDTHRRTYTLVLPLRFVTTIDHDHEGGLWIGAQYGGVTYFSPIAHRFDCTPAGLTTSFCEDRKGRVWTAGEEGGLNCYDGRTLTPIGYANQARLKGIKVHSLCADDDNIWIGTASDGVYLFSTVSGKLRQYEATTDEHSLYDPNSCTLVRDKNGTVWVATMEGLCRYNRQQDRFDRIEKMQSVPVDIKCDDGGCLWVATQGNGVWRYDPGLMQTTTYHHENQNAKTLNSNIVNCVFIDRMGNVWCGTQSGLCRYDKDAENFSSIQLDMPRLSIAAIAEDEGTLWLSGDHGILRYIPGKNMQRFTRHDGLDSEQFQPNAVLKTSDGRICFGTTNGFCMFYPYKIQINSQTAPVYITQLEINNLPVSVGGWHLPKAPSEIDKIDLYYNEKMFSLSFASLSYCSPEKNMYAYILVGFDKNWNYTGHEHKATYTNLPPGKYTLHVKATNNDGIWSDETMLSIEVHPPFWWTVYAKIFYVILFIVLITAFIRFRLYLTERRHRKEIEQLNKAKEEEMRVARTEFFTTIAHEIRTPVSLIIGPLEALKNNLQKSNATPSDQETLGVIDRNAHRLLELVNQLLDFRKVEQNQQELEFAPQNMHEVLEKVAANFETVFNLNHRRFVVNYPDEHFTAVIDREGIVKVLSNLLSNANKYTRDLITLGCKPLPDGKRFCIEVSDNGSGISLEDQKRVFDPFFQTKDRKPGTGIGLSIVKKIVEQHHGTVDVTSELGRGTTFTITLPIAQAYSGEPKSKDEPSPTLIQQPVTEVAADDPDSAKKPVMLIVDDNEDMLTFLVTTFMDQYDVIPAHDGAEALKILEESLVVKDGQTPTSHVDIIISDWMMVNMDGPELCSRMRQNTATHHIPFILLTAKTDSQSKVQAMKAGVDAFIEKPFAVKYLEACIHNLLNRQNRQAKN